MERTENPRRPLAEVDLAAGNRLFCVGSPDEPAGAVRDLAGEEWPVSSTDARTLVVAASGDLLEEGSGVGRRVETPLGVGYVYEELPGRARVVLDRPEASSRLDKVIVANDKLRYLD